MIDFKTYKTTNKSMKYVKKCIKNTIGPPAYENISVDITNLTGNTIKKRVEGHANIDIFTCETDNELVYLDPMVQKHINYLIGKIDQNIDDTYYMIKNTFPVTDLTILTSYWITYWLEVKLKLEEFSYFRINNELSNKISLLYNILDDKELVVKILDDFISHPDFDPMIPYINHLYNKIDAFIKNT